MWASEGHPTCLRLIFSHHSRMSHSCVVLGSSCIASWLGRNFLFVLFRIFSCSIFAPHVEFACLLWLAPVVLSWELVWKSWEFFLGCQPTCRPGLGNLFCHRCSGEYFLNFLLIFSGIKELGWVLRWKSFPVGRVKKIQGWDLSNRAIQKRKFCWPADYFGCPGNFYPIPVRFCSRKWVESGRSMVADR